MKTRMIVRLLAAGLGLATTALATDSQYQSYIVGDRAAGMGGAMVSLANSVDACYYNPAGLTEVKANTVSLSANLYGFQRYKVDNGLFPGEDIQSGSFVTIPASMGGIYKYGSNLVLALSVFVPDRSSYSEIVAYNNNQHLYQFSVDDQTLWAGPSAAYLIAPNLSIGASIFGLYRSFNESVSLFYEDFDASYARGRKFNDVELLGMIGLQYRPGYNWSIGLNLQSPTAHIYDNGKVSEHILGRGVVSNNYYYTEDVDTVSKLPMEIGLGIGRQAPGDYAYGIDLTYHLPTSSTLQEWQSVDQQTASTRVIRQSVLDVNVGGEYYVRKIYPIRAGFYTGFSSVPEVNESGNDASANVDTYGLTFSVGREVKNVALNVGINYIFGSGHDLGYEYTSDQQVSEKVVKAWEQQIYLTVNTAYYF